MSVQPSSARAWPAEVYLVGCGGAAPGDESASAECMGFKAWNLRRMAELMLPVPPAFVLGTRWCNDAAARRAAGADLWLPALRALERASGRVLGDTRRPLLLAVRSGAPVSMPGMMETLLNVGLCDATVTGFLRMTGNPRLVWDAYRRLVASYGEVVAGVPSRCFEAAASALFGARDDRGLDFAELRELTHRYLEVHASESGRPFPQCPKEQLASAVDAVFDSWQAPKAREYRRLNDLSDSIGTAVTVQRMVFGNAGGRSGAGVGFTRDPATGEPAPCVDFLFNAQGEDVVSGRRSAFGHEQLAAVLPDVWQALVEAARRLEESLADMQDFEFTVQDGRLFMLQTRTGKRTALAAARIALDLLDEGVIDVQAAAERTVGLDRRALGQRRLVAGEGQRLVRLGRAPSVSPGVAVGEIALDEARVAARRAAGVPIVLVRRDADTGDVAVLDSAVGLLTQRGARTSHAAVVARQMGKVCLVGAGIEIDEAARTVRAGEQVLHEGDTISLDGNDGTFYAGAAEVEVEYPEALIDRLDAMRRRAAARA